MADPEKTEQEGPEKGPESQPKKSGGSKVVAWLVPLLVVAACAGAGFLVGRLFGTRGSTQNLSAAEQAGQAAAPAQAAFHTSTDAGPTWFYEMEPVIGNLNESGVVRYIRLGLTLEVGGISEKDGIAFFEQKKPLMRNWLMLYLSSLTPADVLGDKNGRQMQTRIADAFNQNLFAGTEGRIKQVLFRENSLQ